MVRITSLLLALSLLGTALPGAEPSNARLRTAVEEGVRLVERAGTNYPTHRRCFSCHHQTLPVLAHVAAWDAGVDVGIEFLDEQLEFTRKSFARSQKKLAAGERIGGGAATVTYGLWTDELAGVEPNDLNRDMVEWLLRQQDADGGWSLSSQRPPFMQSRLMMTALALSGFETYGTEAQAERKARAIERARAFVEAAEPRTQEDHNARLWAAFLLDFDETKMDTFRQSALAAQHDDGGFGQLPGRSPDAYATGQTIWILRYTGLPVNDPALQRAAAYLLETRERDGSWYVRTRVKPVQVYFDNGDPHDRDQFLSTTATSWAVAGLASLLEPREDAPALESLPASSDAGEPANGADD